MGTTRGSVRTDLTDLAEKNLGRVGIESLDITQPDQIEALRHRLAG